jgi:hypothetical protein
MPYPFSVPSHLYILKGIHMWNPEDITPDNALTILIDILDKKPIWEKEPNVKICCKAIGAKIIGLQTKIDDAVTILQKEE